MIQLKENLNLHESQPPNPGLSEIILTFGKMLPVVRAVRPINLRPVL